MESKPRIAVVSPFVDRQHGTERCLAEQLERLARVYEVHLYSARVSDLNLAGIHWHRVSAIGGPELFSYLWFFAANHFARWRDKVFHHLSPELLYSPGINCVDANVISIHVVFTELRKRLQRELRLTANPLSRWPRTLHRKMYYAMTAALERFVYSSPKTLLISPSNRIAAIVARDFQPSGDAKVIYHGCDPKIFNPTVRKQLRNSARAQLGLREDEIALLLIGNDWKNKGAACLIEAVALASNERLCILAVGKDDPAPYRELIQRSNLNHRVQFLSSRPDVEFYYSAADIYAGPSAEDAFSLPPLEAMDCGLPVITSQFAGVSEIIHNGQDGFILEDPTDAAALATLLQRLALDENLRDTIGNAAVLTASQYSWDRNAYQLIDQLQKFRRAP